MNVINIAPTSLPDQKCATGTTAKIAFSSEACIVKRPYDVMLRKLRPTSGAMDGENEEAEQQERSPDGGATSVLRLRSG